MEKQKTDDSFYGERFQRFIELKNILSFFKKVWKRILITHDILISMVTLCNEKSNSLYFMVNTENVNPTSGTL